jgi:hypothetical protein
MLRGESLVTRPGEAFHYSNANYVMLAAIVEHASGMPYEDYVQEHIFRPLGMGRSAVEPDAALSGEMAAGHRLWFGLPVAMGPYNHTAYLDNVSTAEDMTHYLAALLNGGGYRGAAVCSAETVKAMETPAARMGPSMSYAMGLEVDSSKPYLLIRHPGDAPDFSADIALMPNEGWGVIVLQNANWLGMEGNTGFISGGITEILEGRDPPPLLSSPGSIRWFYDGIYVVTLFFLAMAFARLGRWRGRIALLDGKKLKKKLIPVVMLDFAMPLGMLLFLPKFFSADWAQGMLNAPDFSMMMILIAMALLVLGGFRAVFIIRRIAAGAVPYAESGRQQ